MNKQSILFLIIFSTLVFNFKCKNENNVSNILNSLGLINSITITSFENDTIKKDTIYYTKSTNEINYFKSLFIPSGHANPEGKTLQMTSTHKAGQITFGYEQNKTFDIYYNSDCCYWFYYKDNLVWSLFSKRLSEFIGGHYSDKHREQTTSP